MEKKALEWRRGYVCPAQCKQGPCLSWSPLNFCSVVTDNFVDLFDILPCLEGRSLQGILLAKIKLTDVDSLMGDPKKYDHLRKPMSDKRGRPKNDTLKEPKMQKTDNAHVVETIRRHTLMQRVDRFASCTWSPLLEPICAIATSDGTVGIFFLDRSARLVQAQVTKRKMILGCSERTTLVKFYENGDLITANGTSVQRWVYPSFENAGDSRKGRSKIQDSPVTALEIGYFGLSDGSVWDEEKCLWETREVPVSCLGKSEQVLVIAWGDLLGVVDFTTDTPRRKQMDLQHGSLINSICVQGSRFCVVTANANVAVWDTQKDMPMRFKAGPEQETQIQQGFSFRLQDRVVLPCVGASLSPGGALFAICTTGDANLIQQYYKSRHLGACVEVWFTKNPMADSVMELMTQHISRCVRPLSLAEFFVLEDDLADDPELMERYKGPIRNALLLEAKKELPEVCFSDYLAALKSSVCRKNICFCSEANELSADVRKYKCEKGHEMMACVDSLVPISVCQTSYEVCDFCHRATARDRNGGICSFCLHKTTLLKMMMI